LYGRFEFWLHPVLQAVRLSEGTLARL